MRPFIISIIALAFSSTLVAQEKNFIPQEVSVNKFTIGTLLAPQESHEALPLVILIQDSGAIDRNGNKSFAKNDASKHLAIELAKNNIASYRYDKRIFQMRDLSLKEKDLRFPHLIEDATAIIKYFKEREQYSKIVVIGHGEGSLVGMIAAQEAADGFISLSGAGQPVHKLLLNQIEDQLPGLKQNATNAFNEMLEKGSTKNYEPVLDIVFNPKAQPYLLSWMQFDPAEEISKLKIPTLIVAGTLDSQTPVTEAEILKKHKPNAELVKIKNMNYVLRIIEMDDDLINAKSYNEPQREIAPQLVNTITEFIQTKI